MGVQIHIATQDMLFAGWKVSMEFHELPIYADDEVVGTEQVPYLIFEHNGVVLHSYSPDSFCADCNDWGKNKAMFRELGLLGLPHSLF